MVKVGSTSVSIMKQELNQRPVLLDSIGMRPAMPSWRTRELVMSLSMLGFVRCFDSPILAVSVALKGSSSSCIRISPTRVPKRRRSTSRASGDEDSLPSIIGDDIHDGGWETWEFGSWKVRDEVFHVHLIGRALAGNF